MYETEHIQRVKWRYHPGRMHNNNMSKRRRTFTVRYTLHTSHTHIGAFTYATVAASPTTFGPQNSRLVSVGLSIVRPLLTRTSQYTNDWKARMQQSNTQPHIESELNWIFCIFIATAVAVCFAMSYDVGWMVFRPHCRRNIPHSRSRSICRGGGIFMGNIRIARSRNEMYLHDSRMSIEGGLRMHQTKNKHKIPIRGNAINFCYSYIALLGADQAAYSNTCTGMT